MQALVTQISQTAVCNRLHPVDKQLCRWLLLSFDRIDSDMLVMTHEMIANMLGTRREGVTVAAGRLQDAGLIDYHRGCIQILDRQGLEDVVCECYQVGQERVCALVRLLILDSSFTILMEVLRSDAPPFLRRAKKSDREHSSTAALIFSKIPVRFRQQPDLRRTTSGTFTAHFGVAF